MTKLTKLSATAALFLPLLLTTGRAHAQHAAADPAPDTQMVAAAQNASVDPSP